MQEEEEGKMKIGPRGPCDYVHDLLGGKKTKEHWASSAACGWRISSALSTQPQLSDNYGGIMDRPLKGRRQIFFPVLMMQSLNNLSHVTFDTTLRLLRKKAKKFSADF